MLIQKQPDGNFRPIAYALRTLKQLNKGIVEKKEKLLKYCGEFLDLKCTFMG